MKLALCITVFLCCFLIGHSIYKSYRERKQFFQSALAFCNHLLVEINFSKNPIEKVILTYKSGYSNAFSRLLCGYSALITSKVDITRSAIESIMWNRLKPAEASVITDFLYELGRHGAAEECEKVRSKKQLIQTFYDTAAQAFSKEASIYLKLSILLGIGAAILLV